MAKRLNILLCNLLFVLILVFASCSTAKQNPYAAKKKSGSHVNMSQLGRNKYYFSSGYQKKLNKNYKK